MSDMKQRGRLILALAAVTSMGLAAHAAQPAPRGAVSAPAERAGWWMRVNPTPGVTHVYWRFGAAANQLGAPITWQQGVSPIAVDAPGGQRMLPRVHIAALGMPPAAPVSFCLFYQDHGVALVEFTRETVVDASSDQSAEQCMP